MILNTTIQYKNDLYEVAKAHFANDRASVQLTLDVYILNSKVEELVSKHLGDKCHTVIDRTMRAQDRKTEWDSFTVTQNRYSNYFVTYQASKDMSMPEDANNYCSVVQINYNGDGEQAVVDALVSEIKDNVYEEEDSTHFYVIGASDGKLMLRRERIELFDIDIELNYGKDFVKVYDNILTTLINKNSGLVLFHGVSGSGKTTLVRHLISQVSSKKDIIYVPSFLMNEMANPDFISFIRDQRESILILEDAEEILEDREEGHNNQAVSNILNITNGLLNDALKIQVIATFNMDKKRIDKALLRAGRLIEEWHFDLLKPDEAAKLAAKLGHAKDYKKSISLADVYDDCEESPTKKKKTTKKIAPKRVGFKDEEDAEVK